MEILSRSQRRGGRRAGGAPGACVALATSAGVRGNQGGCGRRSQSPEEGEAECGLLFTSVPLLNLSQKGGAPGICTHRRFESRVVSVFGQRAGVPGKHYRLLRSASCGGARGTLHGIPLVHGDPGVDGPEDRPEELSGQMRSWPVPPPIHHVAWSLSRLPPVLLGPTEIATF